MNRLLKTIGFKTVSLCVNLESFSVGYLLCTGVCGTFPLFTQVCYVVPKLPLDATLCLENVRTGHPIQVYYMLGQGIKYR